MADRLSNKLSSVCILSQHIQREFVKVRGEGQSTTSAPTAQINGVYREQWSDGQVHPSLFTPLRGKITLLAEIFARASLGIGLIQEPCIYSGQVVGVSSKAICI